MHFRVISLGLVGAIVSGVASAADADRVLFAEPVFYSPDQPQSDQVELHDGLSGFAEARFGYGKISALGASVDGSEWALRGSLNTSLERGANIQFDIGYGGTDVGDGHARALTGAVHGYLRDPEAYAIGLFGGVNRYEGSPFNALSRLGGDRYAMDLTAGAEAAVFLDDVTIHGRVGLGQVSYSGVRADRISVGVGGRFYATDNLRFDLAAGLERVSYGSADLDVYSLGATGNYRFSETPVTAFGGYRYDAVHASLGGASGEIARAHNVILGARYQFGSQSLKDEERHGVLWSASNELF
ncbi:hypothetical protein AB2N04_13695 [Nitratireductor sp. GISD-1A_MAKvit]|uniref:hypothetical protein n=1 Tax=Nitratireductor sp. GISD-1A_MAKvit TaxID=3234198 RepID=UPI003466C8DB